MRQVSWPCVFRRERDVSVSILSLFVHLPCFSWHVLHRKTKVTPPHSFFFSLSTSVVKNVSIWILEQQAGGNAQGVVKYSHQADRQCKLYNPDLKEGIENIYLSRREDWAKSLQSLLYQVTVTEPCWCILYTIINTYWWVDILVQFC